MHRDARRREDDDVIGKLVDAYARAVRGLSSQQVAGLGFFVVFLVMVGLQAWSATNHQQPGMVGPQFRVKKNRGGGKKTEVIETLGNTYTLYLVGENLAAKDEQRTMLQQGLLVKTEEEYKVLWSEATPLKGFAVYNEGGMGLSCLQYWNNELYACDDRSGIVFEVSVSSQELYPRFILAGGDGNSERPFKCEWMSKKEGRLYIGSIGKEWVEHGEVTHNDFQWIKVVPGDKDGRARSILWEHVYTKVRVTLGAMLPGYVMHEAVQWSDVHKQWFFLPYRVSKEEYDERTEHTKAASVLVRCSSTFSDCTQTPIHTHSSLGFVEFKFLPDGTDRTIVAVRSQTHPTDPSHTESYLVMFTLGGQTVLDDKPIPGYSKYEGFEVRPRG